MSLLKINNFRNLILGKSGLNVGDSFYFIAMSVALVSVYQINVSEISLFTLLCILPKIFSFLYAPYLDRIKNKKNTILLLQTLYIICVLFIITTF